MPFVLPRSNGSAATMAFERAERDGVSCALQAWTDNRASYHAKFRRNESGFPVLFWSEESSTDSLFWMAAGALCRARVCDRHKPFRSTTNVLTLVMCWAFWWIRLGDRDMQSGLRLDYSLTVYGSLAPSLVAHRVHDGVFHLGSKVPYPRLFSDFDPSLLSARPEARHTNFIIHSYRYPTLCAMLSDFCKLP